MKTKAVTVLVMIVAIVVAAVAAGIVCIFAGLYNVAANEPHTRLMEWILQTASDRSVAVRAAHVQAPPLDDPAMSRRGAGHYRAMCVVCHAAPGVNLSEISQGLNPMPPYLADSAQDLAPAEVFWVTRNGIKMTGMPAFSATRSDEQIWDIAAFVKKMTSMSPAEYAAATNPAAPAAP